MSTLPRFVAASLLVFLLCGFGGGEAASQPTQMLRAALAADFGSLPSGEYPILFNDHTVYARPDTLKQGRVLAALVKDGQIYVPLRSMFEQMGATVSASSDGKTVTAVKSGASVSVTLGKYEVVINGETRPLDVPPILYKGIVLVPVRVISEALGAYVEWVPRPPSGCRSLHPTDASADPSTHCRPDRAADTNAVANSQLHLF